MWGETPFYMYSCLPRIGRAGGSRGWCRDIDVWMGGPRSDIL